MDRLSFCLIDSKYCDFLRKFDPCVPYTMDRKSSRPFIGILLTVNNIRYYAPLSSPKLKHQTMKNQIDLIKINNGLYGVINFNNMIPVHNNSIRTVNLAVLSTDSSAEIQYKTLLSNQLTWCNAHKTEIIAKAQRLYYLIKKKQAHPSLLNRCCNFALDEQMMQQYCLKNNWVI